MDIHRRIKERRLSTKLSMKALAELAGVTWQTVQQWEKPESKGGTAPRRSRLIKVAKMLGTTPEWLQFGSESLPPRRVSKTKCLNAAVDKSWPFTLDKARYDRLKESEKAQLDMMVCIFIEAYEKNAGNYI